MSGRADVICAGIVVADHVAAPVEHLPDAGRLVLTEDCILSIGGCASNVAVDLSKLAIRASVAGCVGDDMFGRFAREVLDKHGVETAHLATTAEASTSQTLILNVRNQDRRFIHLLGANSVFSAADIPVPVVQAAKVLYVGGYFLMDRLEPEPLADLFRKARQAGVLTVLDVVTPGPRSYMEALQILLPHTDYFMPNNDEAELITGKSDPIEQAEIFREAGVGTAVITCGHEGAVLISADDRLRCDAFEIEFVDGTGGGDAFDAGYISGLLESASPERCLTLGSVLGASCVRQSGATDGVFTRDQAEQFLKDRILNIARI